MSKPKIRSHKMEPVIRCGVCGHAEGEHGRTGTRPCLAVDGASRDFCTCDEFRPKRARAA